MSNKLVKRKKSQADSVAFRQSIVGTRQDQQLLEKCQVLWNNLSYFREARARAYRFVYGDQWGDTITVHGKNMTQRTYVASKGNVALQTNLIKKKVESISGIYTKEQNEPVCHARDREEQRYGEVMTTTLQANWNVNKMKLMQIDSILDAIVGGLCASRETWGRHDGVQDVWTCPVNPNYIFFDSTMKDPRFWDMSLIGEMHDIPFNEFCASFCHSEADLKKAIEWYTNEAHPFNMPVAGDITKQNEANRMSFYSPIDKTLCRVYEIWTKETRARYNVHDWNTGELYVINADDKEMLKEIEIMNKERKLLAIQSGWSEDEVPLIEKDYFIDEYWYCRYLTPQGYVVWEGEAPYGNMHPYSICAVPFVDGKIVGLISDAIDQNIAINRILTLHDWVTRAGAKGVTMIPQQLIPDDMDYSEFADQWTSVDGLVFYTAKPGVPAPQQFFGQTSHLNTPEMIRMMHELMEDSAPASDILTGKQPYSGTSAALYAQQNQNASNPIVTFFARYGVYVEDVATKKLKMIQKFYEPRRYEIIAGSIDGIMDAGLNLAETGQIEYDLSIKQSTETPVYRMLANDILMQFWQQKAITLQQLLKHGDFPFGDALLQDMEANQQEMEQGAAPMGMQPTGMETGAPMDEDNYQRVKGAIMNR